MKNINMEKELKKGLQKVKGNKRKYVAVFLLISVLFPFILLGITFLTFFIMALRNG